MTTTSSVDDDPRVAVNQLVVSLALLQFLWIVELEGVCTKTLLAEMTGLSKSRIAQGNLDAIRPSTQARMEQTALQWARERAESRGWSSEDFEKLTSESPRLADGSPALWAQMPHAFQNGDAYKLPMTIELALAVDTLFRDLLRAVEADAPSQFGELALEFSGRAEVPLSARNDDTAAVRQEWEDAKDWLTIRRLADDYLLSVYLQLFTALDAEWGAQYFGIFEPQPIFLFLSPRLHPDFDVAKGRIPKRNPVYRPARRLLEFTHAIARRGYGDAWPARPAGRSQIGKIFDLQDSLVGNYFDGTRRFSMNDFETWWLKLCGEMNAYWPRKDSMASPAVLAKVAILWQRALVVTDGGKFRSVVILDHDGYRHRWRSHRCRLLNKYPPGQQKWPDWLLRQSSSSAAL